MPKQWEVIVSHCYLEASGIVSLSRSAHIRERFDSIIDAAMLAGKNIGQNRSVIIRPTFNERDENGGFFREWRSFDGKAFQECRWEYP